jgi:hypothetical protein
MMHAYGKGALNEADPLSRPPNFVPHATVSLSWNGEVPSDEDLRRKSEPVLQDAKLNLHVVNALRFAGLIREGYSQDSFLGDGGEGTKDSRLEAKPRYFWRLDRLCVPRNSELRLILITLLHDSPLVGH